MRPLNWVDRVSEHPIAHNPPVHISIIPKKHGGAPYLIKNSPLQD